MAGINITIEAMTRQRALSSVFAAYLYAALLVAGPWIFTVLGLIGLGSGGCDAPCAELPVFRSIVIYNSMYSLIVTSPLAFISGRYISEQLHERRTGSIIFVLVAAYGVFAALSMASIVPFYLFLADLRPAEKIASIQNVMLIGSSWLLIPFLGALRAHVTVLGAFGASAIAMLAFGGIMENSSVLSLLLVFNASFAMTNLILLATLVRRFSTKIVPDRGLRRTFVQKWELPAAGLAYALGLWIDKVIMWIGAPSGGLLVAGALKTMPSYDTAMFWAQLSSLPVIAVFFVHVETSFSSLVRAFHTRFQQQASLRELNQTMVRIKVQVVSHIVGLFAALAIVATMMVMLSFVFMNELGLRPTYMSILRISLVAMVFHTSAMFCFVFLLHFDLRRPAVAIVTVYAVLNGALTLFFLSFGQEFYGYGNMIASAATFLVAFGLLLKELPWLHYHAFVTNNASV